MVAGFVSGHLRINTVTWHVKSCFFKENAPFKIVWKFTGPKRALIDNQVKKVNFASLSVTFFNEFSKIPKLGRVGSCRCRRNARKESRELNHLKFRDAQ